VTLVWDDNDIAQPWNVNLEFLVPLLPLLIAEKTLLQFLDYFLDTPQQAVMHAGARTVLIAKCAIPQGPASDALDGKVRRLMVAAAPPVDLAGMTLCNQGQHVEPRCYHSAVSEIRQNYFKPPRRSRMLKCSSEYRESVTIEFS